MLSVTCHVICHADLVAHPRGGVLVPVPLVALAGLVPAGGGGQRVAAVQVSHRVRLAHEGEPDNICCLHIAHGRLLLF